MECLCSRSLQGSLPPFFLLLCLCFSASPPPLPPPSINLPSHSLLLRALPPQSERASTRRSSTLDDVESYLPPISITLSATNNNNHFSFNSFATSQLALERITSQSEVSPLTLGRLSHSCGPLNGSHSPLFLPPMTATTSLTSSAHKTPCSRSRSLPELIPAPAMTPPPPVGSKTNGRWLKERMEKKKEEARAHNTQLYPAVSVAFEDARSKTESSHQRSEEAKLKTARLSASNKTNSRRDEQKNYKGSKLFI